MPPIALVAEDRLTQAVLQKCVLTHLPEHTIVRSEVKGGRGNVQRELPAYLRLAAVMPVIVVVDLDADTCAPELVEGWQQQYGVLGSLVLRIAVREIESWVLADRRRVAALLGAPLNSLPTDPDSLNDPKLTLLQLARRYAGVELRSDLLPRNLGLSEFLCEDH